MHKKISRLAFLSCLLLAAGSSLCFCDPYPVSYTADGYTVYDLGNDDQGDFIGLGADGTVYLTDSYSDNLSTCPGGTCYLAENPVTGSFAVLPGTGPDPSLLDPGSPCTVSGPGGTDDAEIFVSYSRCSGDTLVFSAYVSYDNGTAVEDGLFVNTVDGGLLGSYADNVFTMNSAGDIAWDDGEIDDDFEAIPTAPEPSTLLLLGTGFLVLIAIARKRIRTDF